MKKIFFITIILVSVMIIGCSEINTPPPNENIPIENQYGCYPMGVLITFNDSCSYGFITDFISQYDSISVTNSTLGATFELYADSGDYYYWLNYFENDPTIEQIYDSRPKPDSLILSVKVSGKISLEEETSRFLQIEHLTLLSTYISPTKELFLDVPENSEERWKTYFEHFPFITNSTVIMICICY